MHVKSLAKRICPPLVADLVAGRPLSGKRPATWEGTYAHLRDVPTENYPYDRGTLIAAAEQYTRSDLAEVTAGVIPNSVWHEPLALLAASISATRKQVRILDFGGGVGIAYVHLLARLRSETSVRYDVVDLESACLAGRKLFADDRRIEFHTSLSPIQGKIDVLYASGVLPYIEDYPALLRKFASFNASYIMFTQLAAGPFPTYAARQLNVPGQVLPYWFHNIQEVIDLVTAGGYTFLYQTLAGPEYDQSAYPPLYRVGRMKTLLFAREGDTDVAIPSV